jgi:hypothetical protein
MNIPTFEEAKILLSESSELNPGRWVDHSRYAAKAAEAIAALHPSLDCETAFVFGLLHDIGRRAGMGQMRHIIDGYDFLMSKGFDAAARICLTHSFPEKDTNSAVSEWDCSDKERKFVDGYLNKIEYSSYDKLIQLCDYLALHTGFCLIEKRMIDVALRYGVNYYSILKWKAIIRIKNEFEDEMKCSIYRVLPGVVENTFECNLRD